MNPRDLPVYEQRDIILAALERNQVIVVESPTGSGKTTQLPIILHEAGYSKRGMIGITQPRRIAAVSVSGFVARQLETPMPGLVGYKMRFDDQTTRDTRIKVMTDGILLQELKLDQDLSAYSVIVVDEAHERSLNIDFVLGLIKRALDTRPEMRLIVSSATINTSIFSAYFDACPVIRIETEVHPVQVVYDDPQRAAEAQIAEIVRSGGGRPGGRGASERQMREQATEALLDRIVSIVTRVRDESYEGDILIFLPGEQAIKECITRLYSLSYRSELHVIPLYGRLSKEEQDEVFPPAPAGKRKIVVATNIAETSITIDGITVVIDSGLAKTNYYNPRTSTSALVEGAISRASADQRRGRAGRTRPGRCYRLYSRDSYDRRELFQTDEIYRTDLSEVVLRMAELGIRDFESFDFISSPGRGNILAAIETLRLLDALDDERALTEIGRMMTAFPLSPRHSRIIVEAIHRYPDVLHESLVAVSFLTSQTPFTLPPGEEVEARREHHRYRDDHGDFVSYLRLYAAYLEAPKKERFCRDRYLDARIMAEIVNVREQLGEIVGALGVPISSGGAVSDYLKAIARGLIQFVCIHTRRGIYQSLTAERIQIHPGSGMFRETPSFIVAGEIVRTSRTYARSVSPLHVQWLHDVSPTLKAGLKSSASDGTGSETASRKGGAETRDTTWQIRIGSAAFPLVPYKGKKKLAVLPYHEVARLVRSGHASVHGSQGRIRARVELNDYTLMNGESIATVLSAMVHLDPAGRIVTDLPLAGRATLADSGAAIVDGLDLLLQPAPLKRGSNQLGMVALYAGNGGTYWFKPNRSFHAAVHESLASVEQLIDEIPDDAPEPWRRRISEAWRTLSEVLE